MISLVDLIGTGAALCSMTSFVPQIVRITRGEATHSGSANLTVSA